MDRNKSKCPYDCEFRNHFLYGECRNPSSRNCYLNKEYEKFINKTRGDGLKKAAKHEQ